MVSQNSVNLSLAKPTRWTPSGFVLVKLNFINDTSTITPLIRSSNKVCVDSCPTNSSSRTAEEKTGDWDFEWRLQPSNSIVFTKKGAIRGI